MELTVLEAALFEQRDEIEAKKKCRYCRRIEEQEIDLESNLAQVVIGVRRSGKSTLCLNALVAAGVTFAYVNFDDERLADMQAADLNPMLELLYKIYGDFHYLFLDEIQNVDGWPLFVNRLLRNGMHIVVTGSNARLLDNELATHLTGRHSQIRLFPFSFSDFCHYKNVETDVHTTLQKGLLRAAFDEYLHQGGFPELLHERKKRQYIDGLFNNILERDVRDRFKIRNMSDMNALAAHLLDIVPTKIVKDNLQKDLGFKSDTTVGKYLEYLKKVYLVSGLLAYSTKSKNRVRREKCYACDVAFMDNRADAFAGENLGWRLETIVYIELRRRYALYGEDLYYYTEGSRGKECDFIVCRGNSTEEAIQVTYDMDNPKTRKREIAGAIAGAVKTGAKKITIITDHERETLVGHGMTIEVVPAYEWLTAGRV